MFRQCRSKRATRFGVSSGPWSGGILGGVGLVFAVGPAAGAVPAADHNDDALTYTITACTASEEAPEPTAVTVDAVPIVVASTTEDYFVLYVSHDTGVDSTVEWPVAVILGESRTTTLSENVEALPAERYRVEKYQVSDPADVDGDCIDDITELKNPGAMNPVNSAASIASQHGAVAIPDQSTFDSFAFKPPYFTGQTVKCLTTGLRTDDVSVYFINTKNHTNHEPFLLAIDQHGDFHRGYSVACELAYDPNLLTSDGRQGVYYWWVDPFFYATDLSFEVLTQVHTLLGANLGLLSENLALYVPNYVLPQIQSSLLPSLRASRVPVVLDQDIFGDTGFLALNPGVGYGRLRQLDADERPHPRDIVIYEALPNELPPVAGIMSTVPQTPLSHVNLRAAQNGIPNAYIRDLLDDSDVGDLVDEYVRLEVTDAGYSIRAAGAAEVEAHYESLRPYFVQIPRRDLSVRAITPLGSIGFDDWDAFGVKAANLAVLGTLGFPEGTVPDLNVPFRTVPDGFAIPFYFYDEFMKANGLYDDVREMLADEDFQADYDVQADKLKKLRKKIKKADTPQWIIDALEAMHDTFPEGQSLRYRSSTNNEDLPGFNGAGLYDSKTQKPDETVEDGIDKSLKQVYASLWNFRAFSEREFHRIDHLSSAMGVLVHPNYSDEIVNGVAVSFNPLTGATDSYYVNSQLGEDLVTNPEAHSVPEELTVTPDGYRILALSNLVKPARLLLRDDDVDQLREHLRTIHDHFEALYDTAEDERFAMEIEFKVTDVSVLAIKQARPWVFPAAHERTPPVGALGATATDHSVTVDWELAEMPTGVYVYEMHLERLDADGGVVWSALVEEEPYAGAHRYSVSGLDPATEYRFRVRLDAEARGDASSEVLPVTTEADPPVAPTGLAATATHDTVSLSWTVPEQPGWVPGPVTLRVMRGRPGGGTEVGRVAWQRDVTGYSFTDTGLSPGRTYQYQIEARMANRWHFSDAVSVTTAPPPEDPDGTRNGAIALDAAAAASSPQRLPGYSLNRGANDAVDYFTFTTTAPYALSFEVFRMLGAWDERIDRGVRLEDAGGDTIAEASPENPALEAAIDPGTYFVRVEATDDGPISYFMYFGLTPADQPEGPLAGFTLVDASDQSELATLTDGTSVQLDDPDGGSYAIRADLAAGESAGSVRLELTGAKTVPAKTENLLPYSIYGDSPHGHTRWMHGQSLPAGTYTLRATAYPHRNLNGDPLGILEVSFTVTARQDD